MASPSCSHQSYHANDVKEVEGEEWVEYQCTDCEVTWWSKSE